MAQIIINGNVRIVPTGLPKNVEARRGLAVILKQLENLHRDFVDAGYDHKAVADFCRFSYHELQPRYQKVLQAASDAVESHVKQEGGDPSLYMPLMKFFYRASDAHTILPFISYMGQFGRVPTEYSDELQRELWEFIGLRLVEAVKTCEAYITLLSQSLNLEPKPFDIASLTNLAFSIAQQRADFKTRAVDLKGQEQACGAIRNRVPVSERGEHEWYINQPEWIERVHKDEDTWRAQSNTYFSSRPELEFSGQIYGYEPLAFYVVLNLIGNHFKAAHQLYFNSIHREYDVSMMNPPNVGVKLAPWGDHHVGIICSDNGIGLEQSELKEIFNANPPYTYSYFVDGNSSTTPTFPLLCDLMSSMMIAHSDGKWQGSEFTLVLPRDIEAAKECPYTPHTKSTTPES
jgi:hypothetical protein